MFKIVFVVLAMIAAAMARPGFAPLAYSAPLVAAPVAYSAPVVAAAPFVQAPVSSRVDSYAGFPYNYESSLTFY